MCVSLSARKPLVGGLRGKPSQQTDRGAAGAGQKLPKGSGKSGAPNRSQKLAATPSAVATLSCTTSSHCRDVSFISDSLGCYRRAPPEPLIELTFPWAPSFWTAG